jgi:tRNA (mo5U34)-methyltransferase
MFGFRKAKPTTVARDKPAEAAPDLPASGFKPGLPATFVDRLGDVELAELNDLLRWNCFVADGKGRRFGNAARAGKRTNPHEIPDHRIVGMDERFGLAGKHVVEYGCFEGVHTIGLAMRAARVTAVDSRVQNVAKAILRCALFGLHPTVFVCNAEDLPLPAEISACDLVFHVGVLYHLQDPVRHLAAVCRTAKQGILLDTHVADAVEASSSYEVDGRRYAYKHYREGGVREVFSGMYDHAKWLTVEALAEIMAREGFARFDVVERRAERNGPRVLIHASRT